jgi:hypothetical protein
MPIHAIHDPTPSLLFFALLWNEKHAPIAELKNKIQEFWGAELSEHKVAFFPMAKHYEKEMGAPLSRSILVLKSKRTRDTLLRAKLWSMQLEEQLAVNGQRSINIDPGLICLDQMTLISTKPYAHRIYIDNNLYAELVYTYSNKKFRPMDWAYPDYREQEVINYFESARRFLLEQR